MTNDQPPPKFSRDILLGLGLTVALHLLQIPLALLSSGLAFVLVGFSQGLYMVPAFIVAGISKRPGVMIGLMIGAGLTLLLNVATCAGLAFIFSRAH
jgi:hypothetical protein